MTDYDRLRRLDELILRHRILEFRHINQEYDENEPARTYDTWRDHYTADHDTQAACRDMETMGIDRY